MGRLNEPNWYHKAIVVTAFSLRRWVIKYLCLPRPPWMRRLWFTSYPDSLTGRYYATQYIAHPWYIKPSLSSRWGLGSLFRRLLGGVLPGDEGDTYHPQGYHLPELGPDSCLGKAEEEMEKTRAQLRLRSGCPMFRH